jgi:hypothetical protein
MFKVIVERPRTGGGKSKGYQKNMDIEDLPLKEAMKRRHQWGYRAKELNENLIPLIRYLRSNVGRPWDDVFSEICETLPLSSTVKRHVREHIGFDVETNCMVGSDGTILDSKGTGLFREFYVHPVSGLLCEVVRRNRFRATKKKNLNLVWISDSVLLLREKGIWFELAMAKPTQVPIMVRAPKENLDDLTKFKTVMGYRVFDKHRNEEYQWESRFPYDLAELYGRSGFVCVGKKSANRRTIKTHVKG